MEDILRAVASDSYKRFEHSDKVIYDKNHLCLYGTIVYSSLCSNNVGNKPYNPLYWVPIGKVASASSYSGLPDGTLLTQTLNDQLTYIVVQSIDGQKYIRVNVI